MVDRLIEGSSRSTRELLAQRAQMVLLISLIGGLIFASLELWSTPPGAPFYVKLVGIALAGAALFGFREPWAVRRAWWLSIGVVIVAYLMTALSGMLGASREYATTAVLFVGAFVITGAIMPWGLWAQCATAGTGALALGAAVLFADGNLGVLVSPPGAAAVIALVVSVVTAGEMQRYRIAYRRELLVRRRAEHAVKRLNAHLERRVLERTAALEMANQMLVEEAAERRRTANALRVSQAQLGDIVDNSTAMIALKDSLGRYLLVNGEFERRLHRSRADIIGRTDRDLFPAPLADELRGRDDEVADAGTALAFEQDLSLPDERRSYICVKFPLHGASATVYGVGSVCTDITPLKQLQEEAGQHQDELAQVLRLQTIGELAGALARESKQPLDAITSQARAAVRRLRTGTADPATLLQTFEQIARDGLRAARGIRALGSLVARDSHPSTPLNINTLAAEAARVLAPQARRHGVTLRVEAAAEMPPVRGDRTQIEQAMLNLMLNGVEAIADAAGPQREVVVATAVHGNAVEVAVSDTGAGIAPAVAAKLFTPFFSTKSHGLGLGLAISRSIIESHGGRLWTSPTPSAGSTFRFSLPIARADLDPKSRVARS